MDARNAQIGLLSLRAAQSAAITNCYTPAAGLTEDAGPYVAAEANQQAASSAQVASDLSGATVTSAAGTSPALASVTSWPSDTPSISGPPPVVLPFNTVALDAPGLPRPAVNAGQYCGAASGPYHQPKRVADQPQMLMPKHFPVVAAGSSVTTNGLAGYAPIWGTSGETVGQGSGGGLNWAGVAVALAVAFGVMAVME